MISAIVLTKNEEKNIAACMQSLVWCDEILVVDDNSTDKTLQIAQAKGAKTISRSLDDDFAAQRNFALGQVSGDWILFIDSDERVSEKLAVEIRNALAQPSEKLPDGFYFKRIDFFIKHWLCYGEPGEIKLLRLAKKNAGRWERSVDEIWVIKGVTKVFKNPLFHYSHNNLDEFLQSINKRSSMNAEEFYRQGKRVNLLEWFKPLGKFIQNYFFKLGFLDGNGGFVFAILMSFHSFLVRGKLFLKWKK